MLKKLFFVLITISLALSVQASMQIVAPIEGTIENNGNLNLGKVQPGETIILRFSTASGSDERWEIASVNKESLPEKWTAIDSIPGEKTLVVQITVPENAQQALYNFSIEFSNPKTHLTPEKSEFRVTVEEGLISSSINSNTLTTEVGRDAEFQIIFVNDSIASHNVRIDSSLLQSWFEPIEVELEPKETTKIDLKVVPQVYGAKGFTFTISSMENGKNISNFDMQLNATPSLVGKFAIANEGFPVFTISLLPYYLINALLSLIIP